MIVIYHKDCADGFCSAFLIWQSLKHQERLSFYAAAYGDPLPNVEWDADSTVVIADFSYPVEMLRELAGKVGRIVVLDHHTTAVDKLAGVDLPSNVELRLNLVHCGSRLVYGWLADDSLPEWLVNYIEDRDLWKWNLYKSKEVSAAIASYPFEFEIWDHFDPTTLMTEGEAILRYQGQLIQRILGNACGNSVNSPVLQSEVGGELAKGRNYADVWHIDSTGRKVHSLRSVEGGADVSKIAAAFGGGGHKHAAGYKETL